MNSPRTMSLSNMVLSTFGSLNARFLEPPAVATADRSASFNFSELGEPGERFSDSLLSSKLGFPTSEVGQHPRPSTAPRTPPRPLP
jgi:hypothetical protein